MELEILGQATAAELCDRLVLEKSKVSRLVNRLVKQGEVKVMQDPALLQSLASAPKPQDDAAGSTDESEEGSNG